MLTETPSSAVPVPAATASRLDVCALVKIFGSFGNEPGWQPIGESVQDWVRFAIRAIRGCPGAGALVGSRVEKELRDAEAPQISIGTEAASVP